VWASHAVGLPRPHAAVGLAQVQGAAQRQGLPRALVLLAVVLRATCTHGRAAADHIRGAAQETEEAGQGMGPGAVLESESPAAASMQAQAVGVVAPEQRRTSLQCLAGNIWNGLLCGLMTAAVMWCQRPGAHLLRPPPQHSQRCAGRWRCGAGPGLCAGCLADPPHLRTARQLPRQRLRSAAACVQQGLWCLSPPCVPELERERKGGQAHISTCA
jgi:hypothetical protein